MKKDKTPQEKYQFKKKSSKYFGYFFKVILISFVPILILSVLTSYLGAPEWLQWIITLVLLLIACGIGFYVQQKYEKLEREQEQKMHRNKKGKIVPKKDDVDLFGE